MCSSGTLLRMVPRAAAGIVLAAGLATLAAAPPPRLTAAPQPQAVRAWLASLELPTYAEGPANPNPPFDLFTFGRFNYPYPIRDALSDTRHSVIWRTLNLENEYLRLTVLPDLGGRIYGCVDKRTGREMFYANTAIKKALIGYRGAWAAFGVEFNFPVSHNWVSMSPVDFATVQHADGSGSIWVGNTDQVYGSRWRVELNLQPGRAVVEQKVDLYNASDVRHRYYWWSNAAVRVWDDSRLVYPTELMGTHGFTRIEPWPVDQQGRDLSIIRNQTSGPVSLFTYRTREPFVGVYHPRTNSGTVHVASPAELPVHKVWSWGSDRDAATWRTALSDDDSAYVELQAGLFRNQETYAFLEPQESVRFTENWLPVRDLGGITRATVDAVLQMERAATGRLRLALDVTREIREARVVVTHGGRSLIDKRVALSPREVWRSEIDVPSADPAELRVSDGAGRVVIEHREKTFDLTPASAVRVGPVAAAPAVPTRAGSAADFVDIGQVHELEGRRPSAMANYQAGLEQYPNNLQLLKAAGRLAVVLGWTEAQPETSGASEPRERRGASGVPASERVGGAGGAKPPGIEGRALPWLQAAHKGQTTDFEVQYYLGLALAASGRRAEARQHLESAQRFRGTRVPATVQLARLSASEGDLPGALQQIKIAAAEAPRATAVGAIELSLLRRLDRLPEARDRARYWLTIDPASTLLRYEYAAAGFSDESLWLHLGADANRVLDLVDHYLALGAALDALHVLDRRYPRIDPLAREPGAVPPGESPLIAYYRGYLRGHGGGDAESDYREARSLATSYVFPNRRSSYDVLRAALKAKDDDHTARFLLGSLYLASGLVEPAIAEWRQIRRAGTAIPTLHRNLALALLHEPPRLGRFGEAGSPEMKEALRVLEEGTSADPRNVEVYLTLDGVLSAAQAAPRDRVSALRRFPLPDRMPSSMIFRLALALAESGDDDEANRLFHGRFFPREEGGTNVRALYAQVRITSARMAADGGRCPVALGILDSLPREQNELAFTAGGLADAVAAPALVRQIAAIEWTCGRRDAARARWERLERPLTAAGAPMTLAIADEARKRLGKTRTADQRRRLEDAIEAATRTLDSGGTSSPGLVELARASLLSAVGRQEEARRSWSKVFLYPDRNLSHALARAWFPAVEARR
jgi:tetratricopeptide (TPR) repeat protein